MAAELLPRLRVAKSASASDFVFPDPKGRMLSRHTPLEDVLRRALKHAGIVEACPPTEMLTAPPGNGSQVFCAFTPDAAHWKS